MSVYFVKTRTWYQPYDDFFRLADLSGYPLIYLDEMDLDSDNTYIFTPLNGETTNGWPDSRANIIFWDGEWRLKESSYAWPDSDLVIPPGVKHVWASDKWYAERIGAQYVPMGSHVGLVGTARTDEAFDLAVMAYVYGRRSTVMSAIKDKGLTLAPNAWGEERDAVLKASSTMLNVHQHERIHTVTPLRFAIAAAYHLPLISESVYDAGVFDKAVLYADYADLAGYTALMVRRWRPLLQHKADELHELLCIKNSFKSFVQAAL
jgi:hypothetical protein